MKPEFLLGPAEHSYTNMLNRHHWRVVHVLSDLGQVADLLKTSAGFIGNDSGISHLAGFLNIPMVVIFGPSDPSRWKPAGRAVSIMRPELDCEPCFETNPNYDCSQRKCLHRTKPSMVIQAFIEMCTRTGLSS